MSYKMEFLFPTPIYSTLLDNKEDIQNEISGVLKKIKYRDDYESVITTGVLDDVVGDNKMLKFKKMIDEHLNLYCNEIGFRKTNYKIKSWFAKTNKGQYTHVHAHHYSDIAGCYYYQTNEEDGDIFFVTPTPSTTSLCYQKYAERWQHKPMVGKLLLFPGWLMHGVSTNHTCDDRISLAFSIYFER